MRRSVHPPDGAASRTAVVDVHLAESSRSIVAVMSRATSIAAGRPHDVLARYRVSASGEVSDDGDSLCHRVAAAPGPVVHSTGLHPAPHKGQDLVDLVSLVC